MASRKVIIAIVAVLLYGVAFVLWSQLLTPPRMPLTPNIRIGTAAIAVELARTPAQRSQGLSGRTDLAESSGMLFLFDKPGMYPFWMKDMQFALDIIWIDSHRTVIGVASSVSPNTYPAGIEPPGPVQYVLEVNAGFAASHNIVSGQKLML